MAHDVVYSYYSNGKNWAATNYDGWNDLASSTSRKHLVSAVKSSEGADSGDVAWVKDHTGGWSFNTSQNRTQKAEENEVKTSSNMVADSMRKIKDHQWDGPTPQTAPSGSGSSGSSDGGGALDGIPSWLPMAGLAALALGVVL